MSSMRATGIVMVAALWMGVAGCKKDGAADGTAPAKVGAKDGNAKPRVTSPAIAELLAGVPGDAMALGFIDVAQPPWALLTGGVLPLEEPHRQTLDQELRAYVDRYLGLDLSMLQYAVGFISGPERGAVLLKTVGGTLKMPGAQDVDGGKLWVVDPDDGMSLAFKGGVVVFGTDQAVRQVLETLGGKRKAVTTENPALVDWLRKESKGAALAFAAIKPKGLPLPPQIAGLERVAVQIGATGIAAVVDGDAATISSLQGMIDEGFGKALAEIEQAHQAALAGDVPPPEGMMAIIGAAYARSYAAKLKPKRDGNRLAVALDLGFGGADPMIAVSIAGMLAAVAVPAFISYKNKARAAQQVDLLSDP